MNFSLPKVKLRFSALLCILLLEAFLAGIYNWSFISPEILSEGIGNDIFVFITILLNPIYIFFLLSPVFFLLTLVLPQKFKIPVLSLIFGMIAVYLFVDRYVFQLFKFHINSFVLKVLMEPDALVVLGIGTREISVILTGLLLGIAAQYLLLYKVTQNRWFQERFIKKGFGIKGYSLILLLFFTVFLLDKGNYAFKLFERKPVAFLLRRDIPLYIPFGATRFFTSQGFVQPKDAQVEASQLKKAINYPLTPYQRPKSIPKKQKNIIMILGDSTRADMLNQQIMPNTYKFAEENAITFLNHYSGSNGTTQGLFSIFTGLPSSYMQAFAEGQVEPVFLKILEERGYNIQFLSSRSLGWLGADKVIFFKYREYIQDEFSNDSEISDQLLTKHALAFLNKEHEKPFFLFLFYDAPHIPHYMGKGPFMPNKTSLIFDPSHQDDREKGTNQYKNAVHFMDKQMAPVFSKIKEKGYLKDTIVLFSSDHGSEKYEHGHWGHASAFTDEQLRTPLVLYHPDNQKGKKVTYPTSHHDLVPTLLDLIGETYPHDQHTLGLNLLSKPEREYIIAAGLANRVLIHEDFKIDYTPFEGLSYYLITGKSDEDLLDKSYLEKNQSRLMIHLFQDLSKFYH